VRGEAAVSGERDHAKQHRVLGLGPGPGLLIGAGVLGQRSRLGRRQGNRGPGRIQPQGHRVRGVQIVVEHAVGGRLALLRRLLRLGSLPCIGAQQVVRSEAAGRGLRDDAGAHQFRQQRARLPGRHARQAGGGVHSRVGTRMQPG
jgi:hypothetical protein